jgi:hypothetical protein
MSTLKQDLENADPGDVIEVDGEFRLARVENIRGEPDAWVTLDGGGTAVLVPDRSYVYSCFRPVDARYFRMKNFLVDGEGFCERGIQIWTSEYIECEDLTVQGVKYDGLHFVGSNHTRTFRYRFDGGGGQWLRPGVAGHGWYVTILDGGDDVTDHVLEDAEVIDCLGAPFQGNGENRWVRDMLLRRVRAVDWRNGCCVNLGRCQVVTIEDLIASSNEEEVNGGVRGFDGSSGIEVIRHDIQLPPATPKFEGVARVVNGIPAPPDFSEAPEPPEPPEPEPPEPEPPEPEPEPEEEPVLVPCPSCQGTGQVLAPDQPGPGNPVTLNCQTCLGSGLLEAG